MTATSANVFVTRIRRLEPEARRRIRSLASQPSEAASAAAALVKKVAFPKLAQYSARYRLIYDFGTAGRPTLVLMDLIMVGKGRSEITLMLSARYADRAAADGAGLRMAKRLLTRVTA